MGKYNHINIILLLGILLLGIYEPVMGQKEDCRLKLEDLKPVIQRLNPFFANHTWDS